MDYSWAIHGMKEGKKELVRLRHRSEFENQMVSGECHDLSQNSNLLAQEEDLSLKLKFSVVFSKMVFIYRDSSPSLGSSIASSLRCS